MNAVPSAESITSRFAVAAAKFATHAAVSGPTGTWTYAELDRNSDRVAAEVLREAGKGDRPVALLMEHDVPLIAAILGVLKANKMYVALDPAHRTEQLAAMLASSGATLLLADEPALVLTKSLAAGRIKILPTKAIFSKDGPRVERPEVSGETGAWLMFTSGSTNAPRGVWQSHQGVVHEAVVYAKLTGLNAEDRVALLAACGLSASGATLFGTLLTGATLCLFDVRAQGTERLAEWLAHEHITVFHTVPTIFRHLARATEGKNFANTLRLIRLGGEPVLPGDVEIFRRQCPDGCRFMQSLSSTETGLISTFTMDKKTVLANGRLPAGRAVPGVDIYLVDENGCLVDGNEEGRIAVRSRRLRLGYWGQPELTAEKFKADGKDPAFRVFISNDLGKFLPDGMLEHLGRADQLVKIRGQRVDLGQVEAALQATGLFAESAAATVEDPNGDRRLIGYVVPRIGADVSATRCRRALQPTLPEHMVPAEFISLGRLPQTPGGKVDRRALPVPPPRVNHKEGHRSRDRFEVKLAEIWMRVLRLDTIGIHDDFFELGGDSLRSVEVLVQIEEALGVALGPSALAEHSTVAQLAAVVAGQALTRSTSPLIPLRPAPTGRPLFLVHNGHGDVTTFARLARRLPGRPIYGLQSVGLDGAAWPLMTVPAMAKRYLEEIVKVDPEGPYYIAGTCMGGLIAFEMAQQLTRLGRAVGMVAVIVTPAPPFTGHRSKWHELFLDPVRDAFRILRWGAFRLAQPKLDARWLPAYRHFIAGMNSRAARRYRPEIYPGKLMVFTATDISGLKEDRRQLMGKYAREAQIIAMSFPSRLVLTPPGVDELARHFEACLETDQI